MCRNSRDLEPVDVTAWTPRRLCSASGPKKRGHAGIGGKHAIAGGGIKQEGRQPKQSHATGTRFSAVVVAKPSANGV